MNEFQIIVIVVVMFIVQVRVDNVLTIGSG